MLLRDCEWHIKFIVVLDFKFNFKFSIIRLVLNICLFSISGFAGILLLAVANFNQIQGQAYRGSCENAEKGQTFHKCEMKCNFDGSCEEVVSEESCGCDGQAYFAAVTNYFQVC